MNSTLDAPPPNNPLLTNLQELIAERLRQVIGNHGVPVLTEYVWHMVASPAFDVAQIKTELTEFLNHDTGVFVEWLQENVISRLPQFQPDVESKVEELEVLDVQDDHFDSERRPMFRPEPERTSRRIWYEPRQRNSHATEPYDRRSRRSTPPPEEMPINLIPADKTIIKLKKRCLKFPNCPFGDHCRYIHPKEVCSNWPRCPYGAECFYLHPEVPCKFGTSCLNWCCNYNHPTGWSPPTPMTSYAAGIGQAGGFFKNKVLKVDDDTKECGNS